MARQIFVQDRETKLLLNAEDRWTAHQDKARDFHNTLTAITWCLQHGIQRAQVVMRFNTTGAEDVVVPILMEGSGAI